MRMTVSMCVDTFGGWEALSMLFAFVSCDFVSSMRESSRVSHLVFAQSVRRAVSESWLAQSHQRRRTPCDCAELNEHRPVGFNQLKWQVVL